MRRKVTVNPSDIDLMATLADGAESMRPSSVENDVALVDQLTRPGAMPSDLALKLNTDRGAIVAAPASRAVL
jgi:hypothetical protein